nr:uncharacterized protein LOC131800233 [Pocillopora verrucosa]
MADRSEQSSSNNSCKRKLNPEEWKRNKRTSLCNRGWQTAVTSILTLVLLIAGDFNFHVDDTTDTAAANFLSLLESFDLQQHIRSCTHRAGHTLDLVITRDAEYILNAISVDNSSEISDHYTVCADLRFVKPNWERKRICGRKLKAISLEHFRQDVAMSPLLSESSNDLLALLHLYNSELSRVLDKHTPLKSRMVTIRPAAPWFSEEIKLERRVRCRLERRWRRTRLPKDRLRLIEQNRIVDELLLSVRSQYYTKLIDDNCLNQGKLFGIVGKLLHRSPAPQYPSCSSVADLGEKIITIRNDLESNPIQGTYLFNEATVATTRLHHLSCPSYSTLLQIVHPLASKSCELDPVPSRILLGCLDLLCPVIWKIVKLSLETSVMPTELKQAVIHPLLKKPSLDYQEFKNFRPISNLTLLSKVIEIVVALQLVGYIDHNGLC